MSSTKKTKDVFGIQRDLPLNYIEREADRIFNDSLDRAHHVVIYGSSKRGKTSLRKKNLEQSQYILIHCNNKWDIYNININILKQAGYEITVSEKKTVGGKAKINAKFGWNFLGKAEAEIEASKSRETMTQVIELDPEDVNDIIHALESISFKKFIILEDFHYLNPQTQKDFAIELKAFHENSKFTFIIIGVWLEENRLIALNGDLAGRVKSVNADEWRSEELVRLIKYGETLLNVKFSDDARFVLVLLSLLNVYIIQEVCYEICIANGVYETAKGDEKVMDCSAVANLLEKVVDQHAGRYNLFVSSFIDGFQATELEMHKWVLFAVLTSDTEKLEKGIRRNEISKLLEQNHPKGGNLNSGNLTQALNSVASLQVKKGITPIILDYDSGSLRLNVVDKGFLIWLANKDIKELLKNAGLPYLLPVIE